MSTSLTDLLKLCVLDPTSEHFEMAGRTFLIKEASAGAVAQYRDWQFARTKFAEDGKVQASEGVAESDLYLLSLCLFEPYQYNGEMRNRGISLLEIKSWPNSVTTPLVDWVKKHSGLTNEPAVVDQAKNSQPATTEPSA